MATLPQSVTDLDSYRLDVNEEDNCDSDVADLEGLNYLGRNSIMDVNAGGTLSPCDCDLTGPNGPYVTDGPVGQTGMLSPSTSSSEILVDPGVTLPSSDLAGMLLPDMPVALLAVMYAVLLNIGAPSDHAVGCPAWDGGCHREMVDDWTIHELTIYELMMVVVYMFCAYVLLCIFCSQGFSRFASLSGVIPRKLVWGIVRSFLGFEDVRAWGGE